MKKRAIFLNLCVIAAILLAALPVPALAREPIEPPAPATSLESSPAQKHPPSSNACALLDDPRAQGLMPAAFETRLRIECGRENELGGGAMRAAVRPGLCAPGAGALVNGRQCTDDRGPSQSVAAAADSPITLRYDFVAPRIARVGERHSVTIEGLPKLEQAGMPRLPIKAARILIPFSQQMSGIEVSCDTRVELEGSYVVEPGQEPLPLSHRGPVTPTPPSPEIYGSSEPFPATLYSAPSAQMRKGYQMLMLTLYPVQYVPQQGSLSYCGSMTVQVDTEPAPPRLDGMLRHRPRQWTADRGEIQAIVDNPEAAEGYPSSAELAPRAQGAAPLLNPGTPYDYVIITDEDLMSAPSPNNFQALAMSKEARGISALITTTEWISSTYSGLRPDGGEDLQTKIRNFISDAYQTWGAEYILLGGDGDGADVGEESGDAIIPHRGFASVSGEIDYDIPADMYYACLDGSFDYDADGTYAEPNDGPSGGEVDLYAEVYVGRAAVDSADELANFIAKTLAKAAAA